MLSVSLEKAAMASRDFGLSALEQSLKTGALGKEIYACAEKHASTPAKTI